MKRSRTNYQLGAMWVADSDTGRHGKIWLERRTENLEMWMWSVCNTDNSGYRSHWAPSYRLCRKEIPIWNNNNKPMKFKRVR